MRGRIEVVSDRPPEIPDDVELHKKGWIAQRIGWIFLFILMVCAAAGLFGNGRLSSRKVIVDNISLEYERFGRFETQLKLTITLPTSRELAEISIPQTYLAQCEIEKFIPQPQEQKVAAGTNVYAFVLTDHGKIILYLLPKKAGNIETTIRINHAELHVSHFIYP